MNRIWAPWRMEYIENVDKGGGCFLCEILKGKNDKENLILHRGKESFVVLNRYPYNSCHLMVVPNLHSSDLLELTDSCQLEMMILCGKSMNALKNSVGAQGFNCGMNFGRVAGAGLESHYHLHIVPRWSGDTNFFPVLGETKSMPEYLEDTYERLIGEFRKI